MYKEVIKKIKGLEGIINCKITGEEQIDEIHIIASKKRQPKRIVRDIETLILVNLDQKIDHKKISIAQVENEANVSTGDRIVINSIYKEHNKSVVHLNLEVNNKEIQEKIVNDREEPVTLMVARGITELIELHTDFPCKIRVENVFTTGLYNEIVIVQLLVNNSIDFKQEKILGAVYINNNLPLATGKACLKALNRMVRC